MNFSFYELTKLPEEKGRSAYSARECELGDAANPHKNIAVLCSYFGFKTWLIFNDKVWTLYGSGGGTIVTFQGGWWHLNPASRGDESLVRESIKEWLEGIIK